MFDSTDSARTALARFLDGQQLEKALSDLVPAILFQPSAETPGLLGGTRFGGLPDLPRGTTWPQPPTLPNAEAIAQRGSDEAAQHMREHFALGLPYAFIGQVDLAEAASLGPAASALPNNGRLLFFYDIIVGCYETGSTMCRVIWDRSPHDALVRLDMPAGLAAAVERYRNQSRALRASFNKHVESVQHEGTNYDAPPRAMRLKPVLMIPLDSNDVEGEMPWDAYLNAAAVSDAEKGWRTQQLLGCPDPVQDDPRLDAVSVSQFGRQHLSREQWSKHRNEIMQRASEWSLLLQLELAEWMQAPFVEGRVYCLIRKDDLASRRFDSVMTVYQQT